MDEIINQNEVGEKSNFQFAKNSKKRDVDDALLNESDEEPVKKCQNIEIQDGQNKLTESVNATETESDQKFEKDVDQLLRNPVVRYSPLFEANGKSDNLPANNVPAADETFSKNEENPKEKEGNEFEIPENSQKANENDDLKLATSSKKDTETEQIEDKLLYPDSTADFQENKDVAVAVENQINDLKEEIDESLATKSSPDLKLVEDILLINVYIFSLTPLHKPYTLTPVEVGSSEYKTIETLVHKHGPSLSIKKLKRVENPFLLATYFIKMQKMKATSFHVEEKLMFHGTSEKNVDSICKNNFNWRRRGQSRGHKFGQGVSFTPDAWYAHHYSPSNLMFLAKVLVSKCEIGQIFTVVPSRGIDTTKNSKDSVFVKYEDDDFYPYYIIHY